MNDHPVHISFTTSTIIKILVLLVGVWLVVRLHGIALNILTAIVIASAIEPAARSLRRLGIPRIIGIILVYVALLGSFFATFYFFLPLLLQEIGTFVAALPTYIEAFNHSAFVTQYIGQLGATSLSSEALLENFQTFANQTLFGGAAATASTVFGGVFSFIMILVFSIYFAILDTGIDDFLRIIVPKKHQTYAIGLWRRSQRKIGLWMQGQILLGLIVGLLVFFGLTVFGVPHAFPLAVLAGLLEIIPVFGPVLSAIPAIAIAFTSGGLPLGLIVCAIYIIVQQFENHLIYPLVVTRVVGVPPLLVILALIIGAELAGFLGIILSVPLAAALQELVNDFRQDRRAPPATLDATAT